MLRILAALLALVPVLWMSSALALGLGDIEVRSRLNQRFSATIPVLSAAPDDLDGLTVTVAGEDVFARSGIERTAFVSTIKLVQSGGSIKVSSDQVVRDPFLSFILEARWNGGRLLREYTVLLDPPGSASVTTSASVAAPAAAPAVRPSTPVAPASRPAPAPTTTAEAGQIYGPVQANQTLWSIAKQLQANSEASMEQMLLALYQGNPQAFGAGNINQLLSGSRLKVPSTEQALAVDAATARSKVAELRGQPVVAGAAPVAAAPAPAAVVAEPAPAAAVEAPAAPAPAAVAETPAAAADAAPAAEAVEGAAAAPPAEAPAAAALSPTIESAAVVTEPVVEPAPAVAPAPRPSALPIEDEGLPLALIGGGLILVLLLVLVLMKRRVKSQPIPGKLAPLSSDDRWLAATPVADPLLESLNATPPPVVADEAAAELIPSRKLPELEATPALELPPLQDELAELPPDTSVDAALGLGLDGGDPLTEADFHLAYGLYDEAIQMLKKAIAEDPERSELKLKLAETYAAAAKPAELQALAESLSGQLTQGEWAKLSEFGRALLPNSPLFAAAATPEAPAPVASVVAEVPVSALSVIDFDLDADLRKPEAAADAVAAPAPIAEPPAPPKPSSSVDLLAGIDLSNFDLDDEHPGDKTPDPGRVDFSFEDIELSLEPEGEEPLPAGTDEVDTKLDLARAYADMGDIEAAGNLLSEVIAGGSDKQKAEAEALKLRLKDAG